MYTYKQNDALLYVHLELSAPQHLSRLERRQRLYLISRCHIVRFCHFEMYT